MRRMPEGLRLVGPEAILLLDRICPYEAARMPARAFRPAEEYVAALGHILRARRDPQAWIREVAFELDLRELFLAGPPEALDAVAEILSERRPESVLPDHLTFLYRDLDFETDLPTYDPHGLRHMNAEDLADLLAADAATERIMAHHAALLDTAFASFFAGWSGLPLRVVSSYEFRPLGLDYDHGLGAEADRRSVVEVGARGRGRLRSEGDRGGARLDDRELHDWLAAHLEHGAIAIRDADLGGHHPWVLVAHDGHSAIPIDRDPAGWRLGIPRPVGVGDVERLTADPTLVVRETGAL